MKYQIAVLFALMLSISSCKEEFLEVLPDDRIVQDTFWQSENDAVMALYGVYNVLQDRFIYGYGGGVDAASPNAHQWAHWEGMHMQVGNGTIQSGDGGIVTGRWTAAYKGINRANFFLENIDKVEMAEEQREVMKGEVYFLRGVFYSLLANSYGGVPIITSSLSVEESKQLERASLEETWAQVHADYDKAIERLPVSAAITGRATLGAALAMKMRAYLYQAEWEKVVEYADKVIDLGVYDLFPSYQGLFQVANENNIEVIFDVQFMSGPFSQGSIFDRYWQPQNLKFGIPGSNSVAPIQNLVDAYETVDGSPVDPANPYENRDPRLEFTILRPGAYFQGQLYPDEIQNHTGQRVGFGIRKYTIEDQQITAGQSPLNFIVLRYADVLLSKAEALIEKGEPDVAQALTILNRIRTERTDVQLSPVPLNLSVDEAREKMRHERRIELALEGLYWADVRRWDIGPDIYPIEVRGNGGELINTKFPGGYNSEKDDYLPIPDGEISLNPNLEQNTGY
ncbi:RagB/SusD family nutrient uptake outer membrane protein [Pontibacter russatus]|uniref:RagB/SusD family nutrient uptake outer membrane protein n=1 Tax=Pontibacter russatus TaxID=2694929 RepID=UPI00137A98A6|nr:RagB/SusD family nutrient uptake outer membrane protein [Pontibacter russatus]